MRHQLATRKDRGGAPPFFHVDEGRGTAERLWQARLAMGSILEGATGARLAVL